jgi:conjugative relaxase-like TrwC/TraI family protein
VLSINPGHSVKYLTREVAQGRENYYTGAVSEGEPPGRWYGTGAEMLGLSGLVDHQDMEAVYEHFVDPRDPAFKDPNAWKEASILGHRGRAYKTADQWYEQLLNAEPYADAERREQLRIEASNKEQKNIAFYDATFSVPKSITVLHAAFEHQEVKARRGGDMVAAQAWAAHKQAIEDAIWAGNNAALDYLQQHAGYSRVGHHGGGAGRFIDAHDWTIASFFQHTSRTNDPQLHIHNGILWRVLCADGKWRTLDSKSLETHRPAAGAIATRTMFEHAGKSLHVLAVMRPDGKSREVLGIEQAINDLFSTRRRAITPKAAELVDAFRARYDRDPTALEQDRLQRQATMATRPRKSHNGETLEQRLDRCEARLHAELSIGLDKVAADVLALANEELQAQRFDPDAVMQIALADVQARKASWTDADLARAVNDALPDYLGGLNGADVAELLEGLARQAIAKYCVSLTADTAAADTLPDELRLADGRPTYERPGGHLYATTDHVRSERALRAAAVERTAARVRPDQAAAFLRGLRECGIELGADQAAAVRGVLSSGANVESLIGPAGTGKSFVVGTLAHAWADPTLWGGQQRRVFGLATSQIASMVLANEGVRARNISQWRALQQRLAEGRSFGDDAEWQLTPGDLVVVDESAMTDTADLAAVYEIVHQAGAKLLLTGDHKQLAAVGAAGGMEMIARVSPAYELTEARRFANAWERDASLKLRDGDPGALQTYRKHGRVIDGGPIEAATRLAADGWLADTLASRHSLLIVDSNEQAAKLAAQVRTELVRLGRVEERGVYLGLQNTTAGVGDVVQGRRNGWELRSVEGNRGCPVNREQYRVLETREDGSMVVAAILGRTNDAADQLGERLTLTAKYVREDLALGYASTVHAAEGLTVDTTHTVATPRTGLSALYVALSRGRWSNTTYVNTQYVPDEDAPTGTVNQTRRADPLAVLANTAERAEPDLAAIVHAEQDADQAASLATLGERFADIAEQATAGRTATMLDRLVGDGTLTPAQRSTLAADEGTVSLARVLRQAEIAGHDPDQVLRDAISSRNLGNARSLASVLHHRISTSVELHPKGDRYTSWVPKLDNPAWQRHLADLARLADQRREQLGADVAHTRPQWAIEALGPLPDADQATRDRWIRQAGAVAAYRELTGHDDPAEALPRPPKQGQVEAYASWRAAWEALGRDETSRAEAEMSDGQLRVRVRAYQREQAWAPDYVAPDLSGTRQAAQRHRADAQLRAAQAEADADRARRAQLLREAVESGALADVLDRQAAQLDKADEIRARWYTHTANTRATAERARHELTARGVNPDTDHRDTTAEHWLEAHQADQAVEDQHRQITDEHDLTDLAEARETDQRAAEPVASNAAADTALADIRDHTAAEPKRQVRVEHDWTRVPTAEQAADSVGRAQRALAELEARQAQERRHQAEEDREWQIARWRADDHAAHRAAADERDLGHAL